MEGLARSVRIPLSQIKPLSLNNLLSVQHYPTVKRFHLYSYFQLFCGFLWFQQGNVLFSQYVLFIVDTRLCLGHTPNRIVGEQEHLHSIICRVDDQIPQFFGFVHIPSVALRKGCCTAVIPGELIFVLVKYRLSMSTAGTKSKIIMSSWMGY